MVTKKQLKDWLDVSTRAKRIERLEEALDREIKEHALAGETTFYVSTGETFSSSHQKSYFYDLWHNEDLSEASRAKVQQEILRRYRDAGFDVDVVTVDHGWDSRYEAVMFRDIHKLVEEDDTND